MHYGSESVARCNVNVGSGTHIANDIGKVNKVRGIDNVRRGRGTGQWNTGIVRHISITKYVVIAVGTDEPVVVFCEPIDAEFLVVVECQLADHRAQSYLRRL